MDTQYMKILENDRKTFSIISGSKLQVSSKIFSTSKSFIIVLLSLYTKPPW